MTAGGLPDPLWGAVRAAGWTVVRLDLGAVTDKAAFMDRCAAALGLPDWFGRNWDALADCLSDPGTRLPTAGGLLVVVTGWREYARVAPDEWDTAQDVFAAAADEPRDGGPGLSVVLAL